MNKKAVALISGGLDSTLAVLLLKEQGIEIEAVNFETMFTCCKNDAQKTAFELGVPLTVMRVEDDYLELVRKPKYGWGKAMNPCVDCRIHMFHLAKRVMGQTGASFMITGEVLDQRLMSQKLDDFRHIEKDCGLEGLIVRPLSAHLLPETKPEIEGIVDRSKLFAVHGRSRAFLLDLAEKYGIENPPAASPGCALTSPEFSKKVRDIFKYRKHYERWEFEILKMGRHFRISPETKIVVARNHEQNAYLEYLHPAGTALLTCENFAGPHALLIGEKNETALERAGRLILRYAQKPLPDACGILVTKNGETELWQAVSPLEDAIVEELRIV